MWIKWIAEEIKGSKNSTCNNFVYIFRKKIDSESEKKVISQKAGKSYFRLTAEIILEGLVMGLEFQMRYNYIYG